MHWLRLTMIALMFSTLALAADAALAEALSGEDLFFQQLPLNGGLAPSEGGADYPGHASLSTASAGGFLGLTYDGTYAADDFSLSSSSPIVHVEWWGSYLNAGNGGGVQQFLISLETDVPADGGDPSHPGASIISQVVLKGDLAPQSGTFTETAITSDSGQLYRYNAELSLPILHAADAVYWLKIVALVNPISEGDIAWGWQNRDYSIEDTLATTATTPGEHELAADIWHFGGDAMTGGISAFPIFGSPVAVVSQSSYAPLNYIDGVDGPTGIAAYGQDMAFNLYTQVQVVPEPATWVLLAAGGAALVVVARRRRHAPGRTA